MVGSALKSLNNKGYNNLLCPSRKDLDLLDSNQVEIGLKKIVQM